MVKKKLLVVQQSETMLELDSTLLKSLGYDVKGAASGIGALAAMRECVPDLVLLGSELSDLDGLKVCQQIKLDPSGKDIPVVMVATGNLFAEQNGSDQLLADKYFVRPYKRSDMAKAICQLLVKPKSSYATRFHPPAESCRTALLA